MKKKITIILVSFILIFLAVFLFWEDIENTYRRHMPDMESDGQMFSRSVNDFGFRLFSSMEKDGNVIISPYGVHTLFLLAYSGAEGEAKKEIREVLSLPDFSEKKLKNVSLRVFERLDRSGAMALYLHEDYSFLDAYKESVDHVHFSSFPIKEDPINEWMEEKLSLPQEDPIIHFLSAIHFNEQWEKGFNKEETRKRHFNENRVEMMSMEEEFSYMENEDLQVVTLPYKESVFSMHIFLPRNESFYEDLSLGYIEEVKDSMEKEKVSLHLPRFDIWHNREMSDALREMGIEGVFDSGLEKVSSREVRAGNVLQSISFNVSEEGEEVERSPVIGMIEGALGVPSARSKRMHVNRPFFFMVDNGETVLFMGHIENIKD